MRTALVDVELADAIRELLKTPGSRLFRYEHEGELYNLTDRRLNEYVKEFMGESFSCKDFRTWGGTLTAAIAFAERGPVGGVGEQKRVDRRRDAKGGRAARQYADCRANSYVVSGGRRAVSRPPHDRRFPASEFTHRDRTGYRPRSGRAGDTFSSAIVADTCRPQSCIIAAAIALQRRTFVARKTVLVCDNCGKEVDEGKGAVLRLTFTDARRGAKQADLCDDCAGQMPGAPAARRGRRPKATAAA